MPVKAVSSPSKSHSRLFRVFAPTTTKRTKLAACLVLVAVLTLLLHPSTRRVVQTDLSASDDAAAADASVTRGEAHADDNEDLVHHRRGSRRQGVDDTAVDDDHDGNDGHDDAQDDHDTQVDAEAASRWGVPGEKPVVLPGAPENDEVKSGMTIEGHDEPSVRVPVDAIDAAADADAKAAADDEQDDGDDDGMTGRTARIVTCPGCRLNALPEVKKFVHELAKYFEPGLKVDFKIGEDPVLHLYDDGKKTEAIALDKFTSDQIIQRLFKHGISPTTDNADVNRVIEAMNKTDE